MEGFLSQVTETATGILDLSLQVKELKEMMEESVRKQTLEVQEKEKDSDFKQSLEAQLLILVMGMQTKEVVAELKEQQRLSKDSMDKKHEEIKRERFESGRRDLKRGRRCLACLMRMFKRDVMRWRRGKRSFNSRPKMLK